MWDGWYQGFRERYLSWTELEAQLFAWRDALPSLVRLESLGKTPEGRELWLMTLGPEPDRARPAVWVDGNMHAGELCGSSVALAFAEQILRLHVDGDPGDLPADLVPALREVLVYVLPRVSPDGAEAILTTGRYVRSVPRDERPNQRHPHWVSEDIDGDGRALVMRKRDPTGEYVESTAVPGLMLPRRLGDPGPYWKVWPEGRIANFDGTNVPDPHFLSDNQTDLNRNFPWSWAPDHEQAGAGAYPLSEPESRAIVAFTATKPHLFGWVNYHTFGGVFIRPYGHLPDKKMPPQDLALYRQLGEWAEALTGYPMVSGNEEFLYEPDKPLHGDLTDYATMQRGAVSWVVELWDLFAQLGIARKKPFVDHYANLERSELEALGVWDRDHNRGRVLVGWRPFEHPQLGAVEVGGVDTRVGLWNPPYERLAEVCRQHVAMCLRLVALAPRLQAELGVERDGPDSHVVTVTVRNVGYLPTYVLEGAKSLSWNEPVWATAHPTGGSLDDPGRGHVNLGHLDGWGRGKFDGGSALFFQRSRGSTGTATARWRIVGGGSLRVVVGSCRVGELTLHADLS